MKLTLMVLWVLGASCALLLADSARLWVRARLAALARRWAREKRKAQMEEASAPTLITSYTRGEKDEWQPPVHRGS